MSKAFINPSGIGIDSPERRQAKFEGILHAASFAEGLHGREVKYC
jgi:hypothetical protein